MHLHLYFPCCSICSALQQLIINLLYISICFIYLHLQVSNPIKHECQEKYAMLKWEIIFLQHFTVPEQLTVYKSIKAYDRIGANPWSFTTVYIISSKYVLNTRIQFYMYGVQSKITILICQVTPNIYLQCCRYFSLCYHCCCLYHVGDKIKSSRSISNCQEWKNNCKP